MPPPYDTVVYAPGQGLTGTAFERSDPLVYYSEAKDETAKKHISKFRENIAGKSKSIIFVQILDQSSQPVGVIRCNNKEETPARHVGRFTKEDILQLQKIAKIISSIHSKVLWLKDREKERERNMNSLHHELLSPLEGVTAHITWMEYHFNKWKSLEEWDMNKLRLKFGDMQQNAKLMDMIVTAMGRYDEKVRLNVREVPILHLLETCKSFLINEANRKGVKIQIDTLYVSKVKGDDLQLMRLFYNLFRNAIKYSDPKELDKFIRIYITFNQRDHFIHLRLHPNLRRFHKLG